MLFQSSPHGWFSRFRHPFLSSPPPRFAQLYRSLPALTSGHTSVNAIADEGIAFCGTLFIGIMLTPDGPSVIEYNTRFGDPETQVVLLRLATDQARTKGALTGACFLELEAQPPELGINFFNTFPEPSRHFRQKWFEAADFCIFNVGGVGTQEEVGIELCNLKHGIRPRVPYVFFNAKFWDDLRKQIHQMIRAKRVPASMADYILFTDDPDEVVASYRKKLQKLQML